MAREVSVFKRRKRVNVFLFQDQERIQVNLIPLFIILAVDTEVDLHGIDDRHTVKHRALLLYAYELDFLWIL